MKFRFEKVVITELRFRSLLPTVLSPSLYVDGKYLYSASVSFVIPDEERQIYLTFTNELLKLLGGISCISVFLACLYVQLFFLLLL